MSVFSASIQHRPFWWQINAVCFVLGLTLAAAWFTSNQITRNGVRSSNPALSYGSGAAVEAKKQAQSESEIKKLREHQTELENQLAKGSDASKTLNKELQDIKFVAGLTEAVGPGVQVTLTDAVKHNLNPNTPLSLGDLIHDVDIAGIVNELKASGAEAISVNGQRIVGSTAIRCVGPVVHINFVPSAPPYVIQAIGEPSALFGGLNLPDGVLDTLQRINPNMVRIEKKAKLLIPAFAGGTQFHFARPPKSPDTSGDKESKPREKDSDK